MCTSVLQCFGYHPDYKLHDARFWQHRITQVMNSPKIMLD